MIEQNDEIAMFRDEPYIMITSNYGMFRLLFNPKNNEFICFQNSLRGQDTFMCKQAKKFSKVIAKYCKGLDIDLELFYPTTWSDKKKDKLAVLLSEYHDKEVNKAILSFMLLLI